MINNANKISLDESICNSVENNYTNYNDNKIEKINRIDFLLK